MPLLSVSTQTEEAIIVSAHDQMFKNSTRSTDFYWSYTLFFSPLTPESKIYGVLVSPLSQLQVSIPMAPQLTTAVNPEGVKQGYTSPGGLFIPPIAPEEQKRQPQQIIQKPRSQAIPIVPPKV